MGDEKMEEKKILKNKIFLYITEFMAGICVMAVELGAQRLLAPYFSSSQIVWTIVIGTIMIAMALGNIYGGKTADKNPNPNRLYARIIIASIWLGLIPWLGKYVIAGLSALLIFTVSSGYLIIASLASCLVLFIFPLFLLGTTTPSLAKYATKSLDESGKTVGTLGAFNTVGSIIGTFLPTFVTIPTIGTNMTFLIFAILLFLIGVIYFASIKVFQVKIAVGIVLITLGVIFGYKTDFTFWAEEALYDGESEYNYLRVTQNGSRTELSTHALFSVQSVYYEEKVLRSSSYYDYCLATILMNPDYQERDLDILVLGMGSGTFATEAAKYYDNLNITGVEIDKKITELAYKYFNMSDKWVVYDYDGRAFLNVDENKYDIIMVDAYQDITIPFQMSTIEFFTLVKNHLKDDGVMVVNLNMRSDEEGNINYYLCDTISNCFSQMYLVDVISTTNRELFASNNEKMLEVFEDNLEKEKDEALKKYLKKYVYSGLEQYEATDLLLTDDKAPVELLGIDVIDTLIDEEISFYKEIYKEKGLKGLLELLQQ